jgi:3-dehydroquinate dehydratase-1
VKFPDLHPAVIGTVTAPAGLRALSKKSLPCHAVEVRVDALLAKKVTLEEIETALKARQHPVLLTLRIPAEGGHRSWKVTERRALFLQLLPYVDAIDVELATAKAMALVIEQARLLKKTVVLSAHALKKPATITQMAAWVGGFKTQPRTILKVAGQIKSWRDLQQLAAILVNHPEWPVAVMGLGPHAAQSRSVLAALGSRLVYGYLDEAAAPGQPSAAEVHKMVAGVRSL